MLLIFGAELIAPNVANAGTGKSLVRVHRKVNYDLSFRKPAVINMKAEFDAARAIATNFSAEKVNKGTQVATEQKKTWIGGPGQPEMQAFQSVNGNNMVDLFSGDFSYNIPLLDAGGYPIGLSYRGGVSMDQEASWVGLGWNVNPGSIVRNTRGLPDDFNGKDSITKELNTKKKWSAGVSVGASVELFGLDLAMLKNIDGSLNYYYDNYTGPGFQVSLSPTLSAGHFSKGGKTFGVGDLTMGISFDSKSGFNINPTYSVSLSSIEDSRINGKGTLGLNYNSRAGLQDLQLNATTKLGQLLNKNQINGSGSLFSSTLSFNSPTFTPPITMPTTFYGFTFTAKTGSEFFGLHGNGSLSGNYNQNYIAPNDRVQKMPAYGYLNYSKSLVDQKALLDFNREKDIPYRKTTPNIAIPFQTYDVFSVSGEGIGGTFRAYRGDVGVLADHQMRTKSLSGNVGVDIGGAPNLVIGGVDVRVTYANTENRKWTANNVINNNLSFRSSDTTYESVYFRNPGEQTSNSAEYYSSIGEDDVVRVKLGNDNYTPNATNTLTRFNKFNETGEVVVNQPITKTKRDRRSQVMTYLSATEASLVGFEKEIRSYPLNRFPLGSCDSSYEKIARVDSSIRKPHHMSEVTVLNPDGRRYIYGIPAYNLVQKEATFAVSKSNAITDKGLVAYNRYQDFSTNNDNGKDGYFNLQTTPANAHSFLLTELLSADYVDVTGNGISDDDIGDAVKFNYSRMKWGNETGYRWRTPVDESKANYDEGLRTDNSDDKAHLVYGEKEVWYLNSIESKTMIATFTVDTDSLRKDAFEVKDIHGGRAVNNKKLPRLKEINLYSKADLKKLGSKARPVKTVHFSYSYRLCKGYPDLQDMNTGKLTLESVWFTYNGSKRGKENPYVFKYNTSNPNYQYKAYDRWGNYKPASDNPNGIPADDYPYAIKDGGKAATNAGAWCLDEVNLPSGAKMKVEYESDDYAFVQNRRALEMFQIAGFGSSASSTPSADLYSSVAEDNRYVFVDVPVTVNDAQDIAMKYLQDVGKLYFKLHVQMPHDSYGSGYEYIPVYAGIKSYGKVNSTRIWIELESSPEGEKKSPLATAAIQFLRLNLPSKAYKGSDVGNEPVFKGAIMAVLSIIPEITTLVTGGFNNAARIRGLSKNTMLTRSFVRLSSPALKKYGGGHRVKRITISDNWQKMTGKKESLYGQEYEYTTTRRINGIEQTISSGVAAYEPSIGNEENPFRQPIEYKEKVTLAPSNFLFVEEPYAESLFPSASVGYSKVKVSSINRKNIKSAPGYEETGFFTAYDFPTITDYTLLDDNSYKKGIDKFKPFALRTRKFVTQSQGFKIELNDMHGKMKSNAVYAENDLKNPISYTEQFYKKENLNGESYRLVNTVPILDAPGYWINEAGVVGKDVELIADMREQTTVVQSGGVNINVDQFIIPIPPFPPYIVAPNIIPQYNTETSRYRSAGMLKVIQRYGIIDSVVVIDKGSKVSTQNLLWDGETGDVLVTRTQNEFNDPIFQTNFPAHWAYEGVGPAYKNIDAVLQNVNINAGKITSINGGLTDLSIINRLFESGDEILVTNKALFLTSELCAPNRFNRETKASRERRIWAVDRSKAVGGLKDIYFIDRNGNEYTGHKVNIRIIRSGRRNMASTSLGSITSLRSPIKPFGGFSHLEVLRPDSTIGVIATSAAVMKDVWPVEDRFSKMTLCDSSNKVVQALFSPVRTGLVRKWIQSNGTTSSVLENRTFLFSEHFTSSREVTSMFKGSYYTGTRDRRTRGILQFDLGSIPEYALVDSAYLNLYAKRPRYLWESGYWTIVDKAHTTGVNESELLRITQPWDESTTLEQTDVITTQADKVNLAASVTTCQNYQPVVKNMVQAMVSNPDSSYGILLKEKSPKGLEVGPDSALVKHMSFCGYNNPAAHDGGTTCATCTTPLLFVKYHYRKDSCYTYCKSIFEGRINPYTQGIWGNWRPLRSYTYFDRRNESDPLAATNIRRDGEIKGFIPFWNWNFNETRMAPTTNEYLWVWNSEITRVNRRGLETENRDPLGRFNSGLYGYSNTLPIAVAQNSRYREMDFDGFEDYTYAADSCVNDCPTPRHLDFTAYKDSIVTGVRHTGKASLRLGAGSFAKANAKVNNGSDTLSPSVQFNIAFSPCVSFDQIKAVNNVTYPYFTPQPGKQMVLGAWVKEDKNCKCDAYTGNSIELTFYNSGSVIQTQTKTPEGLIIEGWQRYDNVFTIPANADSMTVKLKNNTNVAVYFDDFRIHPYNSNMKSFVYHPTNLRLLAELDENNYASFYEYDDEGTLIRVKKETERGIKTIRETRSAMQKDN
jgi:hypothetical protein